MKTAIRIENFNLYYDQFRALSDVNLEICERRVTAVIGPSGCGKSTLLRAINRMNDLIEKVRVEGQIFVDEAPVYGDHVDLVALRRKVGMVFQRPNPFPLSIFENVAFGLRLHFHSSPAERMERVQKSLEEVGLWEELRDRLGGFALNLSGEQQQRLCIARAIAVRPDIILMDEPCSALDPVATQRIEELIRFLKKDYTIVIVTHNMSQAARVSDETAYFYLGKLIEMGATQKIFTAPSKKETEDYITGKFG
ncbi:MAG: phosphate ABC transporter ATP-binding protein PstB [Candidatus Omnitrophica bacterium]|nr:phosphate ABC transporter ATP-binding protein PstB [Candidatus Omnitrophota bacterium]